MKLRQLSVFLENRTGRLAEVAGILGSANIDIRALTLAETSDFGLLRLLVDRPDEAVEKLSEQGLTVRLTDVVAVEIKDRPGGLGEVLVLLNDAGLNVEYMYAFPERSEGNTILLFRFEESQRAIDLLGSKGIKIFTSEEIDGLCDKEK